MDNRYYGAVIKEMTAFFEENGFKVNGETFDSEALSVKVEYNEPHQIYELRMAAISDGNVGEYEIVTSYLFEDGQTERDAESVGIDFVDSLKKKLGVKDKKKGNYSVELPSAVKGDTAKILIVKENKNFGFGRR